MPEEIDEVLEALVDELAGIEHERWANWQRYLHSLGVPQPDGSLLLPEVHVTQWERQISTAYSDLSPSEQASDREQVRRYLPTIASALRRPF